MYSAEGMSFKLSNLIAGGDRPAERRRTTSARPAAVVRTMPTFRKAASAPKRRSCLT